MNNTSQTISNLSNMADHQEIDDQLIFPLITVEMYKSFTLVSNTFVMPLICMISIIGNALGLGLLWKLKRENKVSIYTYLCALTVTDIVYLAVGFIRRVPNFLSFYDEQLANHIDGYTIVAFVFLDQFLIHTSTAIIVVMSIERVLAVVRPFKVKETYFANHPYKIIILLYAINILTSTPFAALFKATPTVNENNITEYYLLSRSSDGMKIVLIVSTIVDFLVPIVILLCTNTGIAIAYSRIIKTRQTTLNINANNIGSQQKKLTLTVFCITSMFLLLSIPEIIIKILAFVDTEYSWEGKYKHVFWFFQEVINMMTYINAGNDFVIYVLVSDRSRTLFKKMYCSCCIREWKSDETNNTSSNIYTTSGDSFNSGVNFKVEITDTATVFTCI